MSSGIRGECSTLEAAEKALDGIPRTREKTGLAANDDSILAWYVPPRAKSSGNAIRSSETMLPTVPLLPSREIPSWGEKPRGRPATRESAESLKSWAQSKPSPNAPCPLSVHLSSRLVRQSGKDDESARWS